MEREIYTCSSCDTNHSTISNFNNCEICTKEICSNCATLLEIKGIITVSVNKDNVSMNESNYKTFVVCPSCYEKYINQLDAYNIKLIEAEDRFIEALRRVREKHLLSIINMIGKDFKKHRGL